MDDEMDDEMEDVPCAALELQPEVAVLYMQQLLALGGTRARMSSVIDNAPETARAEIIKAPFSGTKKDREGTAASPVGGVTPSPESSGGSGLDDSPDTASEPPRTSGAPDAGPEVSDS